MNDETTIREVNQPGFMWVFMAFLFITTSWQITLSRFYLIHYIIAVELSHLGLFCAFLDIAAIAAIVLAYRCNLRGWLWNATLAVISIATLLHIVASILINY